MTVDGEGSSMVIATDGEAGGSFTGEGGTLTDGECGQVSWEGMCRRSVNALFMSMTWCTGEALGGEM